MKSRPCRGGAGEADGLGLCCCCRRRSGNCCSVRRSVTMPRPSHACGIATEARQTRQGHPPRHAGHRTAVMVCLGHLGLSGAASGVLLWPAAAALTMSVLRAREWLSPKPISVWSTRDTEMSLRLHSACALLLATLLCGCVSQGTYYQEVQKASTHKQLDAQLRTEVIADQAQITQLHNLVSVTLSNGILFAEGGWQLNAAGKATLSEARADAEAADRPDDRTARATPTTCPSGPNCASVSPATWSCRRHARSRWPTSWSSRACRLPSSPSVASVMRGRGQQRHGAGPCEEPPRGHGHHRNEVTLSLATERHAR